MAKKQRPSEGDSTFLAPESLPPPVAFSPIGEPIHMPTDRAKMGHLIPRGYKLGEPEEEPPLPTLTGHGITPKLTKVGWVAYRCTTGGEVEVLSPKAADGSLAGEKKHSAAARMMTAITQEYR